ncbi:MAG TPA: hypothetical protein PK939_03765, partial [Bacteroidales bacterium]|nr:hypothetical protein [Bacteroidales bacterium]
TVGWTAGTVTPNSRAYAIRLQYRVGRQGQFTDVTDENGYPIEYQRTATAGHCRFLSLCNCRIWWKTRLMCSFAGNIITQVSSSIPIRVHAICCALMMLW